MNNKKASVAYATLKGNPKYPEIHGLVIFRNVKDGVIVSAEVEDLPEYQPATATSQPIGPFGFHLHENGDCDMQPNEGAFMAAGGHWNPDNQPHGNHAGDFPVLFSNNGKLKMSFFTNRFKVADIIDRAVVIHENPDDYRTQPSGNSGERIACGVIEAYSRH
ncbi:MAG: superoxide dismutase [Clostridiales bacterium GWF2_38_85]|nr:MAG: superoxide dismutase [Clostridiales bacterium GWF2_38_85]HBL83867.1 superoxide dismutase [Clostridiales bacterium]